jgi:hypothetical protein
MLTYKAKGKRGDWFASVNGEEIPCVHEYWLKKLSYHDPHISKMPKAKEYFASIQTFKKVILTRDDIIQNEIFPSFRRKEYIAVYAIDDCEMNDEGLYFRLTERIANLR